MDRTLREHIARLEGLIESLNLEMMTVGELEKRNEIEAEIRAANTALTHYRAALQIEVKLPAR